MSQKFVTKNAGTEDMPMGGVKWEGLAVEI
jgi:hypothetical protein